MTNERTFIKTHPWMTFSVKLSALPGSVWMGLGEAQSKCHRVANSLLPPDVRERLLMVYLARGVHATTAIEGNTLSEDEVLGVAEDKIELPKSKGYQATEVKNVIAACNAIGEEIFSGAPCELTTGRIKSFNKMVLKDLPLDDDRIVPGEVFPHPVQVAGYSGAPRNECDFLLDKLCEWINSIEPPSKSETIAYGIIKAILAHLYIAWIHPFGDGNGRTARLIEFQILLGVGVPNMAAHLLSNHYNQTRDEYYRQLDYASKSGGDVTAFLEYGIHGFSDQLQEQINTIEMHILEVTWKDYVYRKFREETSNAAMRRRQVALDFWDIGLDFISVANVRKISPKLAEMYAGKTHKTVTRDVNYLVENDFLERKDGMVRGNFAIIGKMFLRRKVQ